MSTMEDLPGREAIRDRFPGVTGPDIILDNAGGSQVPIEVADRIRSYMLESYVQLGADYRTSRRATETVDRAHELVKLLVNARSHGEVVLGPSTSALSSMLAQCYGRAPRGRRDEIVIGEAGHEANIDPWVRLEELGFKIRWWRIDPESQESSLDALEEIVGARTRVVAVHHVSNLLGRIEDVSAITRIAHAAGARVAVDGVAYAPHRAIDVAEWGVDWYVYSTYKVYGPHMAALFGTYEAFAELEGPNFFFVDRADIPYKFELGGVSHESCAGILGLADYLSFLVGIDSAAGLSRDAVEHAFDRMSGLEKPLQERLISYLATRSKVRLIGPPHANPSRVSTISFVHSEKSSREIAQAANARGLGIRFGHFYAHRLAAALGLEPDDGVVRTSLLHYNDLDEVERLIAFFEEAL